ncbi:MULTISPECIES: GntR family transcriptional regulator [unclassified Nonomuraea]|uniref:FadR/GntR family transcriptional regulator n=1 Tax=unclassified Nonomuraea TaxID=2593643 RepID=UPI0033D715C2
MSIRRDSAETPAMSRVAIGRGDGLMRVLKTSESMARDLVRDIIASGRQPGDALPAEAAMLAEYGVSRESLREGLRLLEVQGLISIRRGPGGGPVVGMVDPANLGRTATLYYQMAGATYEELFEAWVFAECELAARAARHPLRDARLAAMAPFLGSDDCADDEQAGVEDFVAQHSSFHATIASLARNRVLELTLQTMGQVVTHHVAVNEDPRAIRDLIATSHRRLAKAIVGGHGTLARTLMQQHIEDISSYHREQSSVQMDEVIEWQ